MTHRYVTLCEDGTHSPIGATTYSLHLVAAQDWSTTGLARFLWDNDGAKRNSNTSPTAPRCRHRPRRNRA